MPPLTTDIELTLTTLCRGCEGIEAVSNMSADGNRFSRALTDLQRLALEQEIPIAIVGGLAAIRYGYPAATQDIDIAVSREQLGKLVSISSRYGFVVAWESKTGWHTLTHGEVEINVVPEGAKARDSSPTEIPGPRQMGVETGLKYASIESWVELKISSDRQKDRAHVVEILKKAEPSTVESIHRHLSRVHGQYASIFNQLIAEAIEESQQENDRR